ncbi:hypothetical protein [Mesorhizobium sp. NZP2077]|uniref:hypothetical protein n=1 Tax=Mesorhizobium sp. NZP2077 TaxID=2483404 RepID=UPI0015559B48|nr:hypothetical protein [Mesorhizobium sp. NZP2077]QKC83284.1 hypothetical protein EB232_18155 [Mesorhizobium sp. NZP2077]QKD16801.1 hypothetical protein HGP13_17940 [Mesorhizobium sp. NZP2077]
MPAAYGSKAHPVQQDPFQQIVEVHWNAVKYIAFPLRILRRSVVKDYPYPGAADGEVASSGNQPWDWTAVAEESPLAANPTTPYSVNYITGFQYEYDSDASPAPGYGGYGMGKSGGGWSALKLDAMHGLPSLPDVRALAPWTVVLCALVTSQSFFSWWPRAEYQSVGGEAIPGLTVPGRSDIPFRGVSSATLQMRGATFTDAPLQGTGFFGGTDGTVGRDPYSLGTYYCKYGVTNFWNPLTGEGMDYVFSPLDIDLASIVITRHGKTYRAIGAALVPPPEIAPTSPGELWILCEKETTTS